MLVIPIHQSKDVWPDGSIQEIVIWQLPERTKDFPEAIKYRLYFGRADGTCIVRYDNEKGKGSHKHIGNKEEPYKFTTPDQLMQDFLDDIDKANKGKL